MEYSSAQLEMQKPVEKAHRKGPGWLYILKEDINCALQRDPAARNWFEVLVNYSGLHAVWFYRIAHRLWVHHRHLAARWLSQAARWITGVEIHPGAVIGRRFFIDHGMGVVIGETSEVGDDVTIYHNVTLGGVSLEKGKRHPTLGDGVVVGTGAKVLGAIEIGSGSRIGANVVVVKSVPPDSVVVGVPGQIVRRRDKSSHETPDLHHDRLPDTLGEALRDVMARLKNLEDKLDIHEESSRIRTDNEGRWIGPDFSI